MTELADKIPLARSAKRSSRIRNGRARAVTRHRPAAPTTMVVRIALALAKAEGQALTADPIRMVEANCGTSTRVQRARTYWSRNSTN